VPGANPAQDEAEIHLLRAVKLNPAYANAHFELGLLYEDEKQDAKAIRQYELATKLRADLSKAHYRLGRLYQKNGQPALAQKEFHAFETLQAK
jgi:tetratricopeptide (TPR) repeat protein